MTVCAVVDLGPACLDLTNVRAGDENALLVYLHQGDQPVDLTSADLSAQARVTELDDMVALSATFQIVDAEGGLAIMRWPGDEIRTLLDGCPKWMGVWDLQVYAPSVFDSNMPRTVAAGKFRARIDVTR